MKQRETSAEVETAAADWAARIDNAPLDPDAQTLFDAWVAGDPRRLGSYARACAFLHHVRRARAFGPNFDSDAYALDHGCDDFAEDRVPSPSKPDTDEAVEPSRLRRRSFLVGGGLFAAGAIAALDLSWAAAAHSFRTGRGEIRRVPLEDGSAMTLDAETKAKVRFTARAREVELICGKAMFEVVHDPSRPFVLTASRTELRSDATSFTVRYDGGDAPVHVVVCQGAVTMRSWGSPAVRTMSENVRALVPSGGGMATITQIAPDEVSRALSWRNGMLSFEDTPLGEAAAEFARYSATRIDVGDPAVASQTVTGLFAASNPGGFADAAALSLGLRVEREEGVVRLVRGSAAG